MADKVTARSEFPLIVEHIVEPLTRPWKSAIFVLAVLFAVTQKIWQFIQYHRLRADVNRLMPLVPTIYVEYWVIVPLPELDPWTIALPAEVAERPGALGLQKEAC